VIKAIIFSLLVATSFVHSGTLQIRRDETFIWVRDTHIRVQSITFSRYDGFVLPGGTITLRSGTTGVELYHDETSSLLAAWGGDLQTGSVVFPHTSTEANWSRAYTHNTTSCGSNTAQTWHFADCTACGSLPPINSGSGDSDTLLCDEIGCTQEVVKAIENDPCNHSPILLDMDRDGFDFSGPDGAVAYDLYGNGFPLNLQWVVPDTDDAFLVHDHNGNGIVDNGTELFGSGTWLLLEDRRAPNGFIGLAQHDDPRLGGNGDGQITEEDEVWPRLLLWIDGDADGLSSADEMTPLGRTKLWSLGIIPRESRHTDDHGNQLRFFARAKTYRGPRIRMVDVYFLEVSGNN